MVLILFGNGVECQAVLSRSTKVVSAPNGDYFSLIMGWAITYPRNSPPFPPDWYHPLFSSSYWVLVPHPEYRQVNSSILAGFLAGWWDSYGLLILHVTSGRIWPKVRAKTKVENQSWLTILQYLTTVANTGSGARSLALFLEG